jgi:hypothetical protein
MSLLLNGTTQRVYRHANVPDDLAFTIMGWVYVVAWGTDQTIFGLSEFTSTRRYVLQMDAVSGNKVKIWNDVGDAVGASALSAATWYHLAMVGDATSVRLYLNGVLEATASLNAGLIPVSLSVGATEATSGAWIEQSNIRITKMRVWDAALSPYEIGAERLSVKAVRTANLNIDSPMSGATLAASLLDFSSNARNWTADNTPTVAADPVVGGADGNVRLETTGDRRITSTGDLRVRTGTFFNAIRPDVIYGLNSGKTPFRFDSFSKLAGVFDSTWTTQRSGPQTISYDGFGNAKPTAVDTNPYVFDNVTTYGNDQRAAIQIGGFFDSANFAGPTVRASGTTDATYQCYDLRFNGTQFNLGKVVADVFTSFITFPVYLAPGDWIELKVQGTLLSASTIKAGVRALVGTWTDSSISSGAAGFEIEGGSGAVPLIMSWRGDSGENTWNTERGSIPVSAVVRTSSTVVTVTLPALPDYDITANETVTSTVPATAVVAATPITATPTFTISFTALVGLVRGIVTRLQAINRSAFY